MLEIIQQRRVKVEKAEMLSDRRARIITDKRHVAMWCYKKLTPYSYPQIGRIFRKDYTTVQYACGKVDYYVEHPQVLEKNGVPQQKNIGLVASELLRTLDPPDNVDQLSLNLISN